MNIPTGTVSFVFTDIEGITILARQHPDTFPQGADPFTHALQGFEAMGALPDVTRTREKVAMLL